MTLKALLKLLLRIAITIVALYLTFSSMPFSKILPLLQQAKIPYIIGGLVCLHAAQIIGALRTRFYLMRHNIELPRKAAFNLHYVAGLFSAFLPGGAGGDAYKAWWLNRYMKGSLKDLIYLAIANRLNGLWSLGVITCLLILSSDEIKALLPYASILIVATILIGTVLYHLLAHFLLKETVRHQYRAGLYSYPLQALLLGTAFMIYLALSLGGNPVNYLILFMLSCIVAMLPLSIGGIGLREFTLLHASPLLGLSPEKGVVLAFGFTLLNLTIPLVGALIYSAWKPQPVTA